VRWAACAVERYDEAGWDTVMVPSVAAGQWRGVRVATVNKAGGLLDTCTRWPDTCLPSPYLK
jgi:hypothetical protein